MMWKRLVQKKLNCGYTLLIEQDIKLWRNNDSFWVEVLDSLGNESISTEIGRHSDLKRIGEAFLKAYERAKGK